MRDPAEKVVVGYLSPTLLHSAFHSSMLGLLEYDMARHRRLAPDAGGGRVHIFAGTNLSAPRNNLVRKFLAWDRADWLWMVDSDMTFTPDVVERLLERADPQDAPIVGGLCFGRTDKDTLAPVLYGITPASDVAVEVVRYADYPADELFPVFATGAACLLIHKSVLAKMAERKFSPAYPWFQESEVDGISVSEDITFCWRANQCGFPVHVDTSVAVGHIKDRVLDVDAYQRQQAGTAAFSG